MLLTRGAALVPLLLPGPGAPLATGPPQEEVAVAAELGELGTLEAEPEQEEEAAEGEAGTGSISVRIGFYDRGDDGDGNPFLDEELTVIEPIVLFDYNATDRFGWSTKLSYDYVSSASIERLSKFDAQSGATGDYYFGADVGFRYKLSEQTRVGWHFGASTEYDYNSLSLGGDVTLTPEERDAEIRVSLDAFLDEVDIIRFDGSEEGSDDRTSVAGSVSWYQVIDPRTHAELGLTVSQQSGFLETPYNAVVIEDDSLPPNPNLDNMARGYEVTEELPDDRLRTAVYGRARRHLREGTSVELGARVYTDSWGIDAFNIEPRLYQDLVPGELTLRLRYRYYDQSESDYWQAHFLEEEEERTQDSDLGPFSSHTLGARLVWRRSASSTWDVGLDYQDRSDGLDQVFASIGWSRSF